jgi:uncharacterized glyoxalase superfamily protein PhnB
MWLDDRCDGGGPERGTVVAKVDDLDFGRVERAKRQGAAVLSAPKDQPWGVRSYAALDPDGHQWEFATVKSG